MYRKPERPRRTTVLSLTNSDGGYLLKAPGEDDSEWNLVSQRVVCTLMPNPDRTGFLPELCTVTFADGTQRVFNPEDWVDVGPEGPA